MAQTTATSSQFSLGWRDLLKGLLMAVLTPVIAIISDSIDKGVLTFNWHLILLAALGGAVGYLIKNFLTPSAIVIKDAAPAQIQAVKDGAAEAKVVNK